MRKYEQSTNHKDIETMKQPIKSALVGTAAFVGLAGTVLIPAAAFAAVDTKNTTINATIAAVISMTTSSTVAISLTPTGSGVVSSASDTVTVSTNNSNGYNLQVADSDATTTLVSGINTITAHTGTKTVATTLGTNSWGMAVPTGTTGIGTNNFDASYSAETNNASSTSKWAGVPATGSPMLLKSTAATATNDTTTVWYAVKVDTSKPTGTYSDTVTYTATTN